MKSLLSVLVSLMLTAIASAQTKFPKGFYEFKSLDKAKAEAASSKKDIAFIYTDKDTTCPLCQGAAADYIDAVKSKTVIVYVSSKDDRKDWGKVPQPVQDEVKNTKYIPAVVVTDSTGAKLTGSVLYEAYKADSRKAIRNLKKALKAD